MACLTTNYTLGSMGKTPPLLRLNWQQLAETIINADNHETQISGKRKKATEKDKQCTFPSHTYQIITLYKALHYATKSHLNQTIVQLAYIYKPSLYIRMPMSEGMYYLEFSENISQHILNCYRMLRWWTYYIFLCVYIQMYDCITVCKSLCIYMFVYRNFTIYTLITCI